MKKITQQLMRNCYLPLFLLFLTTTFGQNGIIGTGFGSNDWTTTDNFLQGAGSSRIFVTTPNGLGNQYFRLVRNWSSDFTEYGPFGCVDTDWTYPGVIYGMSDCGSGSGAFYINCPSTTDNYVFKTPNGDVSKDLLYFRVQGPVKSILGVTQFPLVANVHECKAVTVSATLVGGGGFPSGQELYLRYTKDGYTTSTVVKLAWSGTNFTATIPSSFNTSGENVSYYVFTSGNSGVALDGSNADFYTINLNNNGGSNYSYTVAAGGATTAIPDANFEQALIDFGLDCTIDGKVYTSNISDVTFLDIRNKNIESLVGIQNFSSLKFFYCGDNQIKDLNNIANLTNLWELVTRNNPLLNTVLDLHLNPNLYYLDCENNGLTDLNISGLTKLETLIVWQNSLTSLDVSANPNLSYLDCDENFFTNININGLSKLNYFYCSYNSLETINVSDSVDLFEFYCNDNQLNDLDLRGLSSLNLFDCSSNSPSLSCILVDDINAASAATTSGDWIKDSGAVYSYCNCSLTTTWTSSGWSNGSPTSATAAIISDDYINQSANINACSLTVNTGKVVIIPSGTTITLNAPLIVTPGSVFVLNNNANLIQTNKNSINTGEILVSRESSPLFRLDYTMWSSPVSGTQTLGGFSPSTVSTRFYEYNTTDDLYNAVPSTSPFSLAKGYLIRMPNNWVDFVASPPSTPASWSGGFTGTPNNGDITYALSEDGNGYNAVGNPYPSTLNIDNFINANSSNITGPLYFWRKTNDATNPASYSTCTTAGCSLVNSHIYPNENFISVGQGFIVKATSDKLEFKNSMRVANNTNQFFKTKVAEKNRIWLNLSKGTTAVNQMLLAYMSGATQGIDPTIDGRYFNDSPTALNSLLNNEEFVIQGRALPFNGSDIVPLAFKTDTAGDYTIAIDHVDGLFATGQDVFLLDSTTGAETNLKTEAYTFTADEGTSNSRFSLKYQKTLKVIAPEFNDDSVIVYRKNGTLFVNSEVSAINNIKVFDIQGRLIAEQKKLNTNSATISNLRAIHQTLIVQVRSVNNKTVTKKVVN